MWITNDTFDRQVIARELPTLYLMRFVEINNDEPATMDKIPLCEPITYRIECTLRDGTDCSFPVDEIPADTDALVQFLRPRLLKAGAPLLPGWGPTGPHGLLARAASAELPKEFLVPLVDAEKRREIVRREQERLDAHRLQVQKQEDERLAALKRRIKTELADAKGAFDDLDD